MIRSILADYEARVTALLVQAKAQSLVRPDLDEHGAAVMFTGMIQGLVMRVSIIEARKSMVNEGRLVFPIFFMGSVPRVRSRPALAPDALFCAAQGNH